MLARVTAVRYLHDYVLELHFADGSQGQVDFRCRGPAQRRHVYCGSQCCVIHTAHVPDEPPLA
jgi:hypothetical protein